MKNHLFTRRLLCLVLTALLVFSAAGAAARARLPKNRGLVTDDADVLTARTSADAESYAKKLQSKTGLCLYISVVHFLDGEDVQSYTHELFDAWKLGDTDILLLGAAGEDTAAMVCGSEAAAKLGEQNLRNLLYTSTDFSELFAKQAYDPACAALCVGLNSLVARQLGAEISMKGLFTNVEGVEPAKPAAQTSWNTLQQEIRDKTRERTDRKSGGVSKSSWIILVILIVIIFSQSDPARKGRKDYRRSRRLIGCGCSPIGWILGMLGIGGLLDSLRRFLRK